MKKLGHVPEILVSHFGYTMAQLTRVAAKQALEEEAATPTP